MRDAMDRWFDSMMVAGAVVVFGFIAMTPPFEPWHLRANVSVTPARCVALQPGPDDRAPRCATVAYADQAPSTTLER